MAKPATRLTFVVECDTGEMDAGEVADWGERLQFGMDRHFSEAFGNPARVVSVEVEAPSRDGG